MKSGFSLVELSIVLVILGLLTGGILSGQSLIRAAELRAGVEQYQQYKTALYTFRDRYLAWPGDMPNAIRFWGAADSGDGLGTDCYGTASTDKTTCNGSGDGIIGKPSDVAWGTVHEEHESFRFWQHLANAGLIEGSFTGKTDSSTVANSYTVGINAPSSKLGGHHVAAPYVATGHTSYFSGITYNTNILSLGGGLTSGENWSIDKKLDDESPIYGKVFAPLSTAPWALGCTTTDNLNSEYAVQNSSRNCHLLVRIQ